jgi:hypothetical protein
MIVILRAGRAIDGKPADPAEKRKMRQNSKHLFGVDKSASERNSAFSADLPARFCLL